MPKDERKSQHNGCEGNQRGQGILPVENQQTDEENDEKSHAEEDRIQLPYGRTDVLKYCSNLSIQ
jgi:hypothetical protein